MSLRLVDSFLKPFVRPNEYTAIKPLVAAAHQTLHDKSGLGNDFLGWLDLRGLGLSAEETNRFFLERAKIAADPGTWFGEGGAGFIRLNFACHRTTLDQALEQLREAYEKEFA